MSYKYYSIVIKDNCYAITSLVKYFTK